MTESMIERVTTVVCANSELLESGLPHEFARKILEAMREPTQEMLLAAETPISYDWRGAGTNPSPCVSWPRMIDAALK